MADKINGIFISELLADNAGGAAIDTDSDGSTNKSDEFIELQNTTGSAISLDGYELWSEKNGLLISFGSGDTIAANGTATVVGNYTGTLPAGYFDAGISEGSNFIPDGEGQKFDSIFLVDTATGDYIVLSYGNPPQTPAPPSGFTGTTQIGAGESIDSNAPNGTAFARDASGVLVETSSPTPNTPDVPCFLEGTEIFTETGPVAVEDLVPGMNILTKDAGYVSLRGLGRFAPSTFEMIRFSSLAPVTFPRGTIGNARDLSMSASHRILIEDIASELLFGEAEVLASARSFVGRTGARVSSGNNKPVYYHLLFDRHEIICAEGSWVESLFLADLGIRAVNNLERWTFDDDVDLSKIHHSHTARLVLKRQELAVLLSMNEQPNGSEAVAA